MGFQSGKAPMATDDNLMGGTTRLLVPTEHSDWWPGRSVIWLSGQDRGIAVQVRTKLCTPGRRSWTNSLWHAQPVETNATFFHAKTILNRETRHITVCIKHHII